MNKISKLRKDYLKKNDYHKCKGFDGEEAEHFVRFHSFVFDSVLKKETVMFLDKNPLVSVCQFSFYSKSRRCHHCEKVYQENRNQLNTK